MRIAILGGSFDPIHNGHLQIAKCALKQLPIDEVWFMPTKNTPLKQSQCSSFQDRFKMVALAIHPYRKMHLCTLEQEFQGCSYTIQTVETLLKRYPKDTFCWLIGDDQALQFDVWKDAKRLKQLLPFYVFSRNEQVIALPQGLQRVAMTLIDVSSSEIRRGHKLYQLPHSVWNYIGKQGLYIDTMVCERMNEQRFLHSQSVAKLCVTLAKCHQLDEHVAYLMGLTHDVCKQQPKSQAIIWMRQHEPARMEETISVWHSYLGASYIRQVFHIYDKRVCEAVYHHVKGRNRTDYDRILYIADKLDPARGYDSSTEIALSKVDLKRGFDVVYHQQQVYLKATGTISEGVVK